MKVFLSWSGDRSRAVAGLLSDWLCCVIQAARPWISSRDLDRGSLWFGEINDQLKDTTVGIICLTQENKNRPWILFESGALAKGLSTSRVCTFLVDLEPKDIEDPLAQFNHTFPNRDSILALVRTLNVSLGQAALDSRVLEQVFETYWPQFKEKFEEILKTTGQAPPTKPRAKEDVLSEILDNTRYLSVRLRRLEQEVESTRQGFAFTPSKYRDRVRRFVKLGVPEDIIFKELAGEIPENIIAKYIEIFNKDKPVEPI